MKAKVLLYDIETAPNLAYVWGKYEQDVLSYENEGYILCFAYKWLGERGTKVVALPDFTGYRKNPMDDSALVKELHKLFNEADVIIAHNGNRFDQKKSQARMIAHGLNPPAPYKQIDTKTVAKKHFMFNSNKLDDLGEVLGVGRKKPTGGFGLWLGCMQGNKSAWDRMKAYNKQDVVLLEKVYLKLLPWINDHPNMAILNEQPKACPNCGKDVGFHKNGSYISRVGKFQVWHCNNCGANPRSRVAEKNERVLYV